MAIGWGIISCGYISDKFMAPGIARSGNGRLVAVACRDRARADDFAERHGSDRAYGTVNDLLNDSAVDVVYVASPNSLHAEHTISALNRGKHVLCEKPMALTVADCLEMIAAATRNGRQLGVAFHARFHPAHVQMRRLVASGALGAPVLAEVQFADRYDPEGFRLDPKLAGAGALMDMGMHCIDLLRFVLGRDVVEASAITAARKPGLPLDSLAVAVLRLECGVSANLVTCSDIPFPTNTVRIYCEQGTAAGIGTVGQHLVGRLEVSTREGVSCRDYEPESLYMLEARAFAEAVATGTEPSATGLDGLAATEVALAIVDSASQRRAIKVDPQH